MFNRDQFKAMLTLNFFSGSSQGWPRSLPLEVLYQISEIAYDPNSDIAKALHHAAYARKEDVIALITMLDNNPQLLLQVGNVITPGGLDVRCVTIYEFLLGAGDPDLARQVALYFSRIPDGENQRLRQYKRYKPHIDKMMSQEPYNLLSLVELMKQSPASDVSAMLNKNMNHECRLRDALIQFRKNHAPRIIREPCMHYNYITLHQAIEIAGREAKQAFRMNEVNLDIAKLILKQLAGFTMRRSSGIDRCFFAQGFYNITDSKPLKRTYKYENGDGSFPITLTDDILEGLGGDFSVDIAHGEIGIIFAAGTYREFILAKRFQLAQLMKPSPAQESAGYTLR